MVKEIMAKNRNLNLADESQYGETERESLFFPNYQIP